MNYAGHFEDNDGNKYFTGIVESGSNENGNYVKFSDGTMICSGVFTTITKITDTIGNGYYKYIYVDKPFAQLFTEQPIINVTPVQDWCMIGYVNIDKDAIKNITYYAFIGDNSDKTYTSHYIAIGKWK